MEKKIIFILFLLLFLSTGVALAADSNSNQDVPWWLQPSKFIVDMANESYDYYKSGIDNDIDSFLEDRHLQDSGRNLMFLFLVVAIAARFERFDRLTLMTFAPPIIVYGFGLVVLDNIPLIFQMANNVKDILMPGDPDRFIEFDVMMKQYREVGEGAGKWEFFVNIYQSIIFYIIAFASLVASVVMLAVTLVVKVQLALYEWVAPVMLSGFGSKHTASFSQSFVQQIFKAAIQLAYIQIAITVILNLALGEATLIFWVIASAAIMIACTVGFHTVLEFMDMAT